MSKHNHHHNCCRHKNLGYCEVCKVAYCKDCGKEWRDNTGYWTYPGTWTAPTITYTTCGEYVAGQDYNHSTGTTVNQHNH